MAVALLLIAGILITGFLVFRPKDGLEGAISRLTKSEDRKIHELQKEKFEYEKSQRGIFSNIYAFLHGEQALENRTNPQREIINPPQTQGREKGLSTYRPTSNVTNFRRRRYGFGNHYLTGGT